MNDGKTAFGGLSKKIWWLLLFSFIIRILIFIRFQPWNDLVVQKQILIFDSLGYHNLALCIKDYFTFCGDAFRTPGYPFFVAIIYAVFGNQPYTAIFAQIFLNLLSIILLYKIGKELFSEKVGFIAAVLFSLDLHHTIYIYYILTETIYTTIFLTALLFYVKAIKNPRSSYFIFTGIIYGISTLIRPISQYYIAGVFLFTLIWYFKSRKTGVKFSFVLILAYFIAIAPWCFRNYTEYNHFALSNIKGYNLLFWNASYYESKRLKQPIDSVNANFITELQKMGWRADANPFDKERYDGELANKILKAHFPDYLKTHLIGTLKIHLSVGTQSLTEVLHIPAKKFSEEEKYNNGVMDLAKKFFTQKTIYEILLGLFVAMFLAVVYFFAALGIWRMIKEKQILLMLFILGSAGYFALISGIISYARYRLPSMPFYILLASVGIAWWLERKRVAER
ncbi:MAG TPA: glycosyltransferase family 39 protein [Chitinophagales bacterium]|nr:glycosyltransferase family 39 protein [Chitinophagales bacterium]